MAFLKPAVAGLVLGAVLMAGRIAGLTAARAEAPNAALVQPSGPMVAIVSLKEQTFVLYDTTGPIRSTSVSTGLGSNPTPIGIFSVLEKRKEHWSNIYDAEMPHMQRLTWSGIALHEGKVTGRPASHGCVRLPAAFAEELFGVTRTGTRVIIAQSRTEPVAIAHPVLFVPRRRPPDVAAMTAATTLASTGQPALTVAAVQTVGVDATPNAFGDDPAAKRKAAREMARTAAKIDEDLKKAHAPLITDVARLAKAVETAQRALRSAVRSHERAHMVAHVADASGAPRDALEKTLAAATAKRRDMEARVEDARAALAAKRAANAATLSLVEGADADAKSTWEAYRKLVRVGAPVSVFISGKTGLLQVRQAFDPIFETSVTIADRGEAPLGTHVFTVMSVVDATVGAWSVVTLPLPHAAGPSTAAVLLAEATASRALDRLDIPPGARARIEDLLVPGSSLIIADEPASPETGKGTDFIVELNQPQPEAGPLAEPVAAAQTSAVASRSAPRPQPPIKASAIKLGPPTVPLAER